ncbi:hypothetical protein HZS_937 [Henneguya salminicola]|nr:hypothetical protein HZS_937 [Henneguya salminicola]
MNSYTLTTPECLNKNNIRISIDNAIFCSPLSADNIYSLYTSKTKSNEFIVISTKLDIRCLFHHACVGAESEVTSILVFLSLIKTLSDSKEKILPFLNKNILFIGFDGESWDQIGSSSFAFNLINNNFKVFNGLTKNIQWVEIGPLGLYTDTYYIHTDPTTYKQNDVKTAIDQLTSSITNKLTALGLKTVSVSSQLQNQPLPPSSLNKILQSGLIVPGVYLSDYLSSFSNKFYHGIFDDASNINIDSKKDLSTAEVIGRLTNVSTSLLRVLQDLAGSSSQETLLETNIKDVIYYFYILVTSLADCFLSNYTCEDFSRIEAIKTMTRTKCQKFNLSLDSSALKRDTMSINTKYSYTDILAKYIAYQMGSKFDKSSEECKYKVFQRLETT